MNFNHGRNQEFILWGGGFECILDALGAQKTHLQGAANKSNPLLCFVNISTTNRDFYKKIYPAISHSYLQGGPKKTGPDNFCNNFVYC